MALGGNLMVAAGIFLCLGVIVATLLFTAWRKLCRAPPCGSVLRHGSTHSAAGGRKLSDEASIFGDSLQRPSVMEAQGPQGTASKQLPLLGGQPLSPSEPPVLPLSPDPDRLSPSGQKMMPPVFGYVRKITTALSSVSLNVDRQKTCCVMVVVCLVGMVLSLTPNVTQSACGHP